MTTYIILPIYNEEKNLPTLIEKVREKLSNRDHKIIAVNDGSTDQSLSVLKKYQGDDLKIVGSKVNMNVGAVFSTGINKVIDEANDDDVMIIMESDQTSEIDILDQLIDQVRSGEDVVIASRYLDGGEYVKFPLFRKITSYGANFLMKHFFPISQVTDYTIFFRSYNVGLVKKARKYYGPFGLIQSKGFVANAELLVKLSLLTNKISEIPFIYDYSKKEGKSKLSVLRTINEYFVLIFYLKRIYKKFERLNENK